MSHMQHEISCCFLSSSSNYSADRQTTDMWLVHEMQVPCLEAIIFAFLHQIMMTISHLRNPPPSSSVDPVLAS